MHIRAKLLSAGRMIDDIALDKYIFMRDAYLARRRTWSTTATPPKRDKTSPSERPAPGAL